MTNLNCIFCQQPLEFWEAFEPNNGQNFYAGEPTLIYQCKPCQSQQDFHKRTGERTYYNFRVKQYMLRFNPKYSTFSLGKDPLDEPGNSETILQLNFLPNLTPQNTTEQRLSLFLLFS